MATFSGNAYFESVTFRKRAEFRLAIFSRHADFELATFNWDPVFWLVTFSYGSFASATFSGNVNFESATFSDDAIFKSATFNKRANFGSAKFSGDVDFGSATFSKGAKFGLATFSGNTYFESAKFSGDADFRSVTFSKRAEFRLAIFSGNANFDSAKFDFDSDFVNTKFLSITAFSEAVFHSAVPQFFGATLHEGTAWHGAVWPPPTPHRGDNGVKKRAAQEQVYAYERLKQEMEKLKKHEDEQFFFRKELRARRELYPRISTYRVLNFLYELLSNYGYDVLRPLAWFGGLFVVGFGLFALDPFGFAGTKMSAWHAAHISLANMFGGIPLRTIARNADDVLARPAQAFAIFQTIAGAVLLFLFFLALRNRFRLR